MHFSRNSLEAEQRQMVSKHILNNTDAITAEATTRADAITAEALARTADAVSKHSYFNNNGCNNSRSYNQSTAITAEALARTTADGVQKTQLFQ
jgi:hypothetical protein